MLFLQSVLGLSSNEWILIGVVAAALVLILVTILLIVKSHKGQKAKKMQKNSLESEKVQSAQGEQAESVVVDESINKTVLQEDSSENAQAEEADTEQKSEEKVKSLNKVYHISKRRADNRWQVKMSKGARAIKLFFTQAEAIEYAKKLAINQDARIIIHKEDGSFRKLNYKSKK